MQQSNITVTVHVCCHSTGGREFVRAHLLPNTNNKHQQPSHVTATVDADDVTRYSSTSLRNAERPSFYLTPQTNEEIIVVRGERG